MSVYITICCCPEEEACVSWLNYRPHGVIVVIGTGITGMYNNWSVKEISIDSNTYHELFYLHDGSVRMQHTIQSIWFPTNVHCVLSALLILMQYASLHNTDGLVQERRNSIANALELRLSCTDPSIRWFPFTICNNCEMMYQFSVV